MIIPEQIPIAIPVEDPDEIVNSSVPETVEVTAPTDLPAGYTFVVQSRGRRFPVRVVSIFRAGTSTLFCP